MPELFSWGERGLVASFFSDIQTCDGLSGWNCFLRAIGFPFDGRTLTDAWGVVEPDFWNKGFGHPDFIALLTFDREPSKSGLILEAKMNSYLGASGTDRGRRGFNSTINGQLELNHRLTLALEQFGENSLKLVEPDWIFQCADYRRTPVAGNPRYLVNSLVLEQVVTPLGGLPLEEYYHVIVTAEQTDPRRSIPLERRPRIWLSATQDGWPHFLDRLLWSNWGSLYADSQGWPESTFRKNYEFLRCGDRPSVEGLPPKRQFSGVRLVRLSQDILPRMPPTYLYFSWKGTSFTLFDFSGASPKQLDLHWRYTILDLFANIEDEIDLQGRKNRKRHPEWWHLKTIESNSRAWPEHWSNTDS